MKTKISTQKKKIQNSASKNLRAGTAGQDDDNEGENKRFLMERTDDGIPSSPPQEDIRHKSVSDSSARVCPGDGFASGGTRSRAA